jgi:TRAP-type mannitol/chloroaromatic compound transport system permease large subunit
MARVPGSLAVATIVTCAIFATATGIVGAVVTLMGLLALPAMLRAKYDVKIAAGAITAGGCLGILIPPSVMLIVYGATAGVSVVKLYAGAFFPGIMLATLYVAYIILVAKWKPHLAPPLSAEDRIVPLPAFAKEISQSVSTNALAGLVGALKGKRNAAVPMGELGKHLAITVLPILATAALLGSIYMSLTSPIETVAEGVVEMGLLMDNQDSEAPLLGGLQEPESAGGLQTPPVEGATAPVAAPAAVAQVAEPAAAAAPVAEPAAAERRPAPQGFWIAVGVAAAALAFFYAYFSFVRLEIFKMLLGSFFPLAMLILAVLGTIVFGLATPTEAAAMGSLGGLLLAAAYRRLNISMVRESVYLTAKTSAMVCWLFVGSSIFSAAFALLGGQEIINQWVLSMELTPVQFMLLAQVVIFLLGWPLEWTEIIVIFMPIFIPLLPHFGIDPLFFGLLVALNLQTAFLSPPVAMAAFYLKGVSPPHVTLNQIFAGMMPFMGIQVIAIIMLYVFPAIGMWLPEVLYK